MTKTRTEEFAESMGLKLNHASHPDRQKYPYVTWCPPLNPEFESVVTMKIGEFTVSYFIKG